MMVLFVILIMKQSIQFPYRISQVNEMISREISCYYSTIPIFASYSSMLSQSKEYSLQFLPLSIDINGLSFQYLRNTGCSPSIVTESPTELPPDSLFFLFK